MTANAVIRARISEELKSDATEVLSDMGLTVSDLIRITLTRVARDRALPFDINLPNLSTREAIEESRKIAKRKAMGFSSGTEMINALDEKAR